ncbi:hypothetical protein DOY81_014607, partial [Sarcophaga bullata]
NCNATEEEIEELIANKTTSLFVGNQITHNQPLMLSSQSETIQRVEFHAQQATLFVDKGADELDKADNLRKKAMKKKVMLILIAIVVLLVLILIGVFL